MVTEGTFREDMYYRLHVFPIHNLPFRESKEDTSALLIIFRIIFLKGWKFSIRLSQKKPWIVDEL